MTALDVTRIDLVRALANVVTRPAVDQAVRTRAETLAERIEAAGAGAVSARVERRAGSHYEVVVAGPDLFGREFGSLDREAEPVVAPAIDTSRKAP